MRFLLKLAFWLSIVVMLMPADRAEYGTGPQVGTGGALTAANAAVSDMRQFCARQPEACAVGSQALTGLGQKAQAGAKMLYEFLTTHFGRAGAAENPARTIGKPAQNTLFPADLTAPWRGSPARKEPEPRRPA